MTRLDGLPAQDLDAERGLLGSLMVIPDVIDLVAPVVRPEHFYLESHRKIYAAIVRMHEKGIRGFDAVTVSNELERERDRDGVSDLEIVGGSEYLVKVLDSTPHAAHAEYYAGIVVEKWQCREFLFWGSQIARDATVPGVDPEELAERTLSLVERVLETKSSTVRPVNSGLKKFLESQESEKLPGLMTGFRGLDDLTVGLNPGSMNILAARPSCGKTAYVSNIALNVAREGGSVFFVSLEQSEEEIAGRFIGMVGKLDSHRMKAHRLNDVERERMIDSARQIDGWNIWVDDSTFQKVRDITSKARLIKARHGLDLVIVDYLQLVEPEDSKVLREQQISTASRALKAMAKTLHVPVIVLAQLNRAVEMRENKRPRLSDLRESGAIEQDADLVGFLHRESLYDSEADQNKAEFIIAKHRGGPLGDIPLRWTREFMLFDEPQSIQEMENPFDGPTSGFVNWFGSGEESEGDF